MSGTDGGRQHSASELQASASVSMVAALTRWSPEVHLSMMTGSSPEQAARARGYSASDAGSATFGNVSDIYAFPDRPILQFDALLHMSDVGGSEGICFYAITL